MMGILDSSGMPSPLENVTTMAPDFGWMSGIDSYIGHFTVTSDEKGEVFKFDPLNKNIEKTSGIENLRQIDWHWFPFGTSRFWSGTCNIRFLAIKPPRVVGKLLIRYQPDITSLDRTKEDLKRRGVKIEWDLGLTNECVIEIPAVNPIKARPTWIPMVKVPYYAGTTSDLSHHYWRHWEMYLSTYSLGHVSVEVAQPIQPGSIFPDSVRILVFHNFVGSQFSVPGDCRSDNLHSFLVNADALTMIK